MRTKHRLLKRYAKQIKGRTMRDDVRQIVKFFGATLLFLLSVFLLIVLSFTTIGCSNKTEIVEKPVIVYKPVPTHCDFNITRPPVIDTNSTHSLLNSITELSIDSVMLRKQIKAVPCLNVFEIK